MFNEMSVFYEKKSDERTKLVLSSDGSSAYGTLKTHSSDLPDSQRGGSTIIEPVMVLFIVAKALAGQFDTCLYKNRKICRSQCICL